MPAPRSIFPDSISIIKPDFYMFCLKHYRKYHQLLKHLYPLKLLLGIGIFWTAGFTGVQAQIPVNNQPSPVNSNSSLSAEQNFQQGNLTRAIQQWSLDIKNGTNVIEALFNRSQAYILLKQYDLAVQDTDKINQIQGNNTPAPVFIVRGIALIELNQASAAIESFNKAEKLQPSPALYNNRALAYQRDGKLDKALEDLKKSVQLASTPINRLNLANARIKLGQYNQVVDEMSQLIAQEKTFFPPYLTRGIAYYNLGQYESALSDFVSTLKIWHRSTRSLLLCWIIVC